MQVPYDVARTIFQNASNFRIQCYKISNYPPVEELIRETAKCFSELEYEDDESLKSIRMKIWRLRASVIYSLMPFDSKELGIAEQLWSLQREAVYVPFLNVRIDRLTKIIQFLLETPTNPKREKVFELLRDCPNKGCGTAIVVSIVRGITPGWSKTVADEIVSLTPE